MYEIACDLAFDSCHDQLLSSSPSLLLLPSTPPQLSWPLGFFLMHLLISYSQIIHQKALSSRFACHFHLISSRFFSLHCNVFRPHQHLHNFQFEFFRKWLQWIDEARKWSVDVFIKKIWISDYWIDLHKQMVCFLSALVFPYTQKPI